MLGLIVTNISMPAWRPAQVHMSASCCLSHRSSLWKKTGSRGLQRNRSAATSGDGPPDTGITKDLLVKQSMAMFAAGGVLGPFCDSFHSAGDVLHYTQPTIQALGPIPLETCWWVPLMFGVAGLLLGVSYPVLDQLTDASDDGRGADELTPSWSKVLLCISCFVAQYKLSADLELPLLGYEGLTDLLLLCTGFVIWRAFDNTLQGLAMSILTAVGGPAIEVVLINGLGLYSYSHPQVLGIPTWIPWVYFAGGPAVGLLGRRVWATLAEQQAKRVQLDQAASEDSGP